MADAIANFVTTGAWAKGQPYQRLLPRQRVNKIDLTTAIIDLLVGESTLILIGDITRARLEIDAVPGVAWGDWRYEFSPVDSVVGLPLEPETRDWIVSRVLPRIGLVRRIGRIRIVKDGGVQFRADDGFLFREGFVQTGQLVTTEMLDGLVERGMISGYELVGPDGSTRSDRIERLRGSHRMS